MRDVISAEMWEAINTIASGCAAAGRPAGAAPAGHTRLAVRQERTALFWGVADRTMLRDEAKCFLDAGGLFEVADMVLRMLRVALPPGERRSARTARRWCCCRRSAAFTPTGARSRLRRTPSRSRASCSSRAATRTAWRRRRLAARGVQRRRRGPAHLRAGAAPQPPGGRPRLPRRALPDGAELLEVCERTQRSLRASTRTSPSATSPARRRRGELR